MSRNRPSIEDDEALARELQEQFAAEFRQSQQQVRPSSSNNNNASSSRIEQGGGMSNSRSSSWTARRSNGGNQPVAAPTIAALPDAPPRRSNHGTSARVPPPAAGTSARVATTSGKKKSETIASDKEYASRLERAFRDEDRAALQSSSHHRRSEHRSSFDPDVLNPFDEAPNPPSRNPSFRNKPSSQPQPPPVSGLTSASAHSARGSLVDADEEYARRLQDEIRREEAARSKRRSDSNNNNNNNKGRLGGSSHHSKTSPGMETPATQSDDVSEITADEEVARRVEQELIDEELARKLAIQEQARLSERRAQRIHAVSVSRSVSRSPTKCSIRRVLSYVVPALVLVAVVVGVLLYFLKFNQEIPFFPSPQDFSNEDPFNAKNASEVDKWRTSGNVGLTMEVVAALDSIWLPYFDTAVYQWDNGSPDALTLTKSYQAHSVVCDPINFKIVVCNGNYGDTKWRGINQILLADGYIFASTAKMNEYYFTGADNTADQRQYTMCHEMGHGFGLPHTDESFTNPDLGNCMDYTLHPGVNKQPDASNYKFLEELYGDVPGTGNSTTSSSSSVNNNNSGGGRVRHGRGRGLASSLRDTPIPDWVLDTWRSMDEELNHHAHGSEDASPKWRVLHRSDFGEAHEADIGGGYTIQVHKLF